MKRIIIILEKSELFTENAVFVSSNYHSESILSEAQGNLYK